MKKIRLILFLIPLILVSCHNFHIEKRQHRKGFHLQSKRIPKQAEKVSKNSTLHALKAENEVVEDSALSVHVSHDIAFTNESPKLNVTDSKPDLNQGNERTTPEKLSNENQLILTEYQPTDNTKENVQVEAIRGVNHDNRTNNNALYYFLLVFIIPLSLGIKDLEKISKWGARNQKKSQWLIAGLVVVALVLSLLLGSILKFVIAPWMIFFSLGMMLVSIIVYVFLNKNRSKIGVDLNKRKDYRLKLITLNAFNVFASFGTFALGSRGLLTGNLDLSNWSFTTGYIYTETAASSTMTSNSLGNFATFILIFFFVVSLISILFLSCVLMCSEYLAIGVLTLAGGVSIVVILFIKLLRVLVKNKRQSEYNESGALDEAKLKAKKTAIRNTILLTVGLFLLILALVAISLFVLLVIVF